MYITEQKHIETEMIIPNNNPKQFFSRMLAYSIFFIEIVGV